MTLVIARRSKGKLAFASDYRYTFGSEGFVDLGIKIFSIPLKVYSPIDNKSGDKGMLMNTSIGMAVAGGAVNSNFIKEYIVGILNSIQHIPIYSEISMDVIASKVSQVIEKSTKDYAQILRKNALCEVLIAGYCPNRESLRTFKFSVKVNSHDLSHSFKEVLTKDGIEYLGSGEKVARKRYKQTLSKNPLEIIKEVIESGEIDSVGGYLQFGNFKKKEFKVLGVIDYKLENGDKVPVMTFQGMDFQKLFFDEDKDMSSLLPNKTFVDPFGLYAKQQ